MRDTLAHGLDHARGFHADAVRQVEGVDTAAVIDVDVVQAAGLVRDADLAPVRVADGAILDLKDVGAAGVADDDGAGCIGHGVGLSGSL